MRSLIGKVLIMILTLVFFYNGIAFGEGTSASLEITCTIPVIPGVNTPSLIEEEETKTQQSEKIVNEEKTFIPVQDDQEPVKIIQQDTIKSEYVQAGKKAIILVKTLYVR